MVARGGGYTTGPVEVFVGTEEVEGGGLRPTRVNLYADNVDLSPKIPRKLARYLLEAADVAEEENLRSA